MELQLKDKTALVTGSTSGIGKAIAYSLLREGATVIINGRSEQNVAATIIQLEQQFPHAKIQGAVADLGTVEGCDALIASIKEVDILVNNMGIFSPADLLAIPDEDWLNFFEVNVMSGLRLSRHYLKGMLERNNGRIIFIASEAAIMPSQEMAHYSMTKTAQLSLSRSLAELTSGSKVTVNTIMPGSTMTEGVEKMLHVLFADEKMTLEQAERKFMKENRPTSIIQRLIQPEEIGDFVTFLSSPLASAINGAALRIDGGLVRSIV